MGPGQRKPWDDGDTKGVELPPERTGIDATAARRLGSPFPTGAEAILSWMSHGPHWLRFDNDLPRVRPEQHRTPVDRARGRRVFPAGRPDRMPESSKARFSRLVDRPAESPDSSVRKISRRGSGALQNRN